MSFPQPTRRDAAVAAVALVLALTEAAQVYLGLTLLDADVTWGRALQSTLPSWVVLLGLTLPLLRILDRVPGPLDLRRGVLLGGVASVFTALHLGGTALAAEWVSPAPDGVLAHFYRLATVYFVPDLLTFVAVVALHDGVRRYRADRIREVEAASVRADLAQARFVALRGQLRPDFFFNTLNAIGGLVARGEAARSVDALSSLSALLRVCLTVEPGRAVSVDDEMDLVSGYLSIQKARFPQRLHAGWDTLHGAGRCAAPALLLVHLVETLVEGGLDSGEPFSVNVVAEERGGLLTVRVEHSGPGLEAAVLQGLGERLHRFDAAGELVVESGVVALRLPARPVGRRSRGHWMELGVVS